VGVCSDEGVWVGDDGAIRLFFRKDAAGEVFEVYLMNDSDAGGNNAERLEGLLSPFEEFVRSRLRLNSYCMLSMNACFVPFTSTWTE
jgi:hypothetical protein